MIDLLAAVKAPEIDYQALAPLFAVIGGSILVLIVGLISGRAIQRVLLPLLASASLVVAIVFSVVNWEAGDTAPIVEGALGVDTLALFLSILFYLSGLVAIVLSLRSESAQEVGAGEYLSMLLASIAGMTVLAGAENLVTVFVGFELLSIPLYVLCASSVRDRLSLESGLKYLVVGSVGSATLLYGLAFVYGATGSTDFSGISAAIGPDVDATDPLLLTGVALALVGLAFKASVAPFHQWTPDVYQGAPTPITAFMAVATKVAAFAILLRLCLHAFADVQADWAPALAGLATVTILVGNVRATAFYLAAYLVMNMTAFAVVVARERVSEHGDDLESIRDLSRAAPELAWPMTIAMLALAGFPATAGFIGKFFLIDATVAGDYAWLAIVIVVGSMISLVYYLRVIAVMWMDRLEVKLPTIPPRYVKPVAGWSLEADPRAHPEVVAVAVIAAVATIALGIYPSPLFDAVRDVGSSLGSLF